MSASTRFRLPGCTAIITGASSGLGVEFARQLGGVAACLVLAARSSGPMEDLAGQLRKAHPQLRIEVCPCDLATEGGRARLWQTVDEASLALQPNLLVNNAGLGDYGKFAEADVSRLRQQIDVNITALTLMSHEFVNRVHRSGIGSAGLINVSSLASALPIPNLAVYAASKAYVLSLSEAIRLEERRNGIQVLALCPGPTPTNFGKNARRGPGQDIDRRAQNLLIIPPERVVAAGLRGLERGRACVYPGTGVTIAAAVFRHLPRGVMRSLVGLLRRPKSIESSKT